MTINWKVKAVKRDDAKQQPMKSGSWLIPTWDRTGTIFGVLLIGAIIGFLLLYPFIPESKAPVYAVGVDTVSQSLVVGVMEERSIPALKEFYNNSFANVTELSRQEFLIDSVWIKHRERVQVMGYNEDSTIVTVKTYHRLLKKFSDNAYTFPQLIEIKK